MPNNEDYRKNPESEFTEILHACGWKYIGAGYWEKGKHRLYMDSLGVFLYQLQADNQWLRINGLCFATMAIMPGQYIEFDGYRLNLLEECPG
jgi:hypothetical protein